MTDKKIERFWQGVILLAVFLLGLAIGGLIVSFRYDSEIRTDQVELKADVKEIMADKPIIEDLIHELLRQIKEVKAKRESLEELKIRLSKGEG